MNEIEAAQILKDHIVDLQASKECAFKFYRAVGVALAALREKAERDKGCYKCQTKIFTNRLVAGKDGELFRYVELPHNYCPMCGAKMEDKPCR